MLVVGKEEKTETSEVRFPRQPLKTSLSGAAAGQPGGHRVHTTLETPVLRHLWTSGTLRACRGTLCLSLSAAPAPSWVSAGRLPFAGRRRGSRSRTICPHQNACLPRASSPVWGEERSEQTQRVEATSAEPPPLPAGAVWPPSRSFRGWGRGRRREGLRAARTATPPAGSHAGRARGPWLPPFALCSGHSLLDSLPHTTASDSGSGLLSSGTLATYPVCPCVPRARLSEHPHPGRWPTVRPRYSSGRIRWCFLSSQHRAVLLTGART